MVVYSTSFFRIASTQSLTLFIFLHLLSPIGYALSDFFIQRRLLVCCVFNLRQNNIRQFLGHFFSLSPPSHPTDHPQLTRLRPFGLFIPSFTKNLFWFFLIGPFYSLPFVFALFGRLLGDLSIKTTRC